ncbi:hypothetical protein C8Q80DRAFT_1352795 [Daedaleopsis nitida]|nr:hypothetical protein C8Q80DRAFT_1352795 [Daedaleopsis nitida]
MGIHQSVLCFPFSRSSPLQPDSYSDHPATPTTCPLVSLDPLVLDLISHQLWREDALSLAMTCKWLSEYASPRIVAGANITSIAGFRRFCDHVLHPKRPRAQHVESIQVGGAILVDRDGIGLNVPAVARFTELLKQTHNLRRLAVHQNFQAILRAGEGVREAIQGLHKLRRLEVGLDGAEANDAITFMGGVKDRERGNNIRMLSIDLMNNHVVVPKRYGQDDGGGSVPTSFRTILTTLMQFTHLHMLALRGPYCIDPFRGLEEDQTDLPLLPSVRELRWDSAPPIVFDLARLCPHVVTLDLAFSHIYYERKVKLDSVLHCSHVWPHPRYLKLNPTAFMYALRASYDLNEVLVLNLLSSDILIIRDEVVTNELKSAVIIRSTLLTGLRKLSPICLQWRIKLDGCAPMILWSQIRDAAPRLRYLYLHLVLPPKEVDPTNACLECLCGALSQLALVCLRLHLQFPSTIMEKTETHYPEDVDKLSERFANASNTLRYLVFFGAQSCQKTLSQDPDLTVGDDVAYYTLRLDDFKSSKYVCPWMDKAWHIVHHHGEGKRLDTLTACQKSRLLRFMDESPEKLEHIDEHFIL